MGGRSIAQGGRWRDGEKRSEAGAVGVSREDARGASSVVLGEADGRSEGVADRHRTKQPETTIITTKRLLRSLTLALATSGVLLGCHGSANCVDGAAKNAETGVCLKVTGDYKLEPTVSKAGDSSSLTVRSAKTLHSFTIWIETPDDLDKRAKAVAGMASSTLKLVASGNTSPNSGKFFHFHNGPQNYDFADALIPGKAHFYRCEIQNSPPAEATAMLDMCKTLGGP